MLNMYAGKLAKAAEAVEKLIYGEYKVRKKTLQNLPTTERKKNHANPKKHLNLQRRRGRGAVVLESSRR